MGGDVWTLPHLLAYKKFTEGKKEKDKEAIDQALITIAESLDIGYVHVHGDRTHFIKVPRRESTLKYEEWTRQKFQKLAWWRGRTGTFSTEDPGPIPNCKFKSFLKNSTSNPSGLDINSWHSWGSYSEQYKIFFCWFGYAGRRIWWQRQHIFKFNFKYWLKFSLNFEREFTEQVGFSPEEKIAFCIGYNTFFGCPGIFL